MDVYLRPLTNKNASFRFPSMPDGRIKIKTKTNYQDYDIIKKGTYTFPAGQDPFTCQWDGYFWGKPRKGQALNRKWRDPKNCIKKLRKWQKRGTPLKLIVSKGRINRNVTIQSFTYEPFGGNGDFAYSITLVQYRRLKIYTTDELGIGKKGGKKGKKKKKKASRQPSSKKNKQQYTVVTGDTLWSISLKFYGKGSDWPKIYNENKADIEKNAKAHGLANSNNGWWIYAGTVLKIPT